MTHKELLEEFLAFEEEYDLFNWSIESFHVWEYTRFIIFQRLKNKLVASTIDTGKKSTGNTFKALRSYIYSVLNRNPRHISSQTDILISNHARRRFTEDHYQDIHTDPFLPHLKKDYAVLENMFDWKHLQPTKTANLFFLDTIAFPAMLFRILSRRKFNTAQKDKIKHLRELIENQWDVNFDFLEHYVLKLFRQYLYSYSRIEKILKRINPKVVVIVVYYSFDNQVLTEVAQQLKIDVIEIQHGMIGKLHTAYNFSENANLVAYPDYFLSWGSFWNNISRMPTAKGKTVTGGFPYMDAFRNDFVKREKKKILIISQMSERIALFAKDLAQALPTYAIAYKAHPSEYNTVEQNYPFLENEANITIIKDDYTPLYHHFKNVEFVIGVYSTALIEALVFCENVIIVKLPGWELYEDFTDCFVFIDTVEEGVRYITGELEVPKNPNIDRYFEKNAIVKTCSFIESIG